MNTKHNLILIKGEVKTSEIMSCEYNKETQKWDVTFNNGKTYSYANENVEKLTEPESLNPNMYRISREGRKFFDIKEIYVFKSSQGLYWHICFGNGREGDYPKSELACLKQELSQLVTEQEYFDQYVEESDVNIDRIEFKKKLSSKSGCCLPFSFEYVDQKPGIFK